jgi:hypothetical protein
MTTMTDFAGYLAWKFLCSPPVRNFFRAVAQAGGRIATQSPDRMHVSQSIPIESHHHEEASMRKYIVVLGGLAAMALTAAIVSGSGPNRPLLGAGKHATVSIDNLQRHIDVATLPITQVNEPY